MKTLRNSLGNVTDVHKSLQGYESLKSNLVEFPNIEFSKTRNNSLDPTVKSLKLKLTEMETIVKISRERVRLLEKTVEDLSMQLEKLQTINKTLLSEKLDINSSEIHFFVQDLIVADVKKQLEDAHGDIEKYRMDTERMKKRYESILQENKRIEGSIKRYRKIISEISSQKIQSIDTTTVDDTESVLPSIKKNWGEPQKARNTDKHRVKVLPIIEQHVKEMTEANTIPLIFTKLCEAIRLITSCQKISIYIISPSLQQVYVQYFQSIQHVQRVLLGNTWVQLHTDPSCDVIEPMFNKVEEILSGVRTTEKLIQSVSLQKEPSIIIQCLNPSRPFDSNDEKFISILMSHMAACVKIVVSLKKEKALKEQLVDVVNVSAGISRARNHQSLANSIDQLLPKFFECETAGVVFVDEESKEFYTLAYSSNQEEKFSQDIIRFPISMGLTGETYKCRSSHIFENVKKKHLYNPEIDNIASASDLSTCLMSCLNGPNNMIYGIMQLGNKSGGFSQRDIQLVTSFSTILGYMIAGINDISEAMELTIKMKQHLVNLSLGLGGDINDLSPDSSGIMDQLEIIKSMVSTWSKSKKQKMQNL
ncbi:hypothetical protein SteCoe_9063 [Stentor coeruleus]|uniref:GAF domain-containing protein n=1 Tax=Stentor coeruleus TaxID=5963 RepID=A0A1R2CIJ6_9CILI|nr:hypothetical protein SteCoe_9063 [Stentor coeruleus]